MNKESAGLVLVEEVEQNLRREAEAGNFNGILQVHEAAWEMCFTKSLSNPKDESCYPVYAESLLKVLCNAMEGCDCEKSKAKLIEMEKRFEPFNL